LAQNLQDNTVLYLKSTVRSLEQSSLSHVSYKYLKQLTS